MAYGSPLRIELQIRKHQNKGLDIFVLYMLEHSNIPDWSRILAYNSVDFQYNSADKNMKV